MLRTYIFNAQKNIWIEEEEYLLYHDLCAFLDEDNQIRTIGKAPSK